MAKRGWISSIHKWVDELGSHEQAIDLQYHNEFGAIDQAISVTSTYLALPDVTFDNRKAIQDYLSRLQSLKQDLTVRLPRRMPCIHWYDI